MKIHVAIGVSELGPAVEVYTRLVGREPALVVPDAYALFRTREMNLSLRVSPSEAGKVRHLGFERDEASALELLEDNQGITWEVFNAEQQVEEIRAAWPRCQYAAAPVPTLTGAELQRFADKHVATWNAHDLDAILAMYTDDIELVSPLAVRLVGSATIRGKAKLRSYFEAALARYPDLAFELVHAFGSTGSATLVFRSLEQQLVAEVLNLESDLRIHRVTAHYQ